MNRKYISIMLASVMGMSVLFADASWMGVLSSLAASQIQEETEYPKASSSNMPKEIQTKKERSVDLYPAMDISEKSAEINDTGKYIIRQSDDTVNDISIKRNCELWFDGLDGEVEIDISDSVTNVKIHLLNDCTIKGFADTAASATYVIDSRNLQGNVTEPCTLTGASEFLKLPGNGKVEINSVNVVGKLLSGSYWDVYDGRYKYGASNLKMTKGSVTGDISFTKSYSNTDGTDSSVPHGVIEFIDTNLNTDCIEAGTVSFNNCEVTSGEGEVVSLAASNIQADHLQWTSKQDITLETKGTIKNSKVKCTNFNIENSNLTFENSSVEALGDIMLSPSGTWEEGTSKAGWKNCSVKAGSIDLSNLENMECSAIFDSSNVELNGSVSLDGSNNEENIPGLVSLEIRNKSKVSAKSDDSALILFGNVKITISDSDVVLESQNSAVGGHSTEFGGRWYDPQLILGTNIKIKNNGEYKLINHIPKIVNSANGKDMKYVEIGKAQTSGKNYDDAYPLPTLTGDKRADMIAIAQSQLGYSQSDTGETVYADWAGQPGRPWCSEFASWCASKAGISKQVFPVAAGSQNLRVFYEAKDRYYVMDGGCTPEGEDAQIPIIALSELKPGDLLLTESNGNNSDGPDHTAIFLGLENGYVKCIAGNVGGAVAESYKSVEQIHGVCKPDYEKVISGGGGSGGGGSGGGSGGSSSGTSGSTKAGPGKNAQIQITSDSAYGGSWEVSGNSWRLKKEDGTYASGQWGMVDGKWYLFDQAGYMVNGWQQVNQTWYYLGTKGDMSMGWQNIDGKWYYFSAASDKTQGSMITNTTTPDGYVVNTDGVWIP